MSFSTQTAKRFDDGILSILSDVCGKPLSPNEAKYTHVTKVGKDAEKWSVPPSKLGIFWERYMDFLAEKPHAAFTLEEKADDHNPFIVDCTLHFPKEDIGEDDNEEELLGNKKIYVYFIHYFQQALLDVLNITAEVEKTMTAVLMECYDENGNPFWSDYFRNDDQFPTLCTMLRIYFPFIRCDKESQKAVLKFATNKIMRAMSFNTFFQISPLGRENEDIFTLPAIGETIPMYGSVRKSHILSPALNHIYQLIYEEDLANDTYNIRRISNPNSIFDPLQHDIFTKHLLSTEGDPIDDDNIVHYFPIIFSKGFEQRIILRKEKEEKKEPTFKGVAGQISPDVTDNYKLALYMLNLLGDHRYDNICYWLDIGRALYHATDGAAEGLKAWREITQKRSKVFRTDDCTTKRYYKFRDSPITYKTLAFYAKMDNPAEYAQWHANWLERMIRLAIHSKKDGPLSQALYGMYWLDYACASISHSKWYVFRNNHWAQSDKAFDLSKKVDGEFKNLFEQRLVKIVQEKADVQGDEVNVEIRKSLLEKEKKAVEYIISSLEGYAFKSTVVRQAAEKFYDEKFDKLLDMGGLTMHAVNKCVFEFVERTQLASGQVIDYQIFQRTGKPEDYIGRTSTIPYVEEYHWEHPDIQDVVKWFSQMYAVGGLPGWIRKDPSSTLSSVGSGKMEAINPVSSFIEVGTPHRGVPTSMKDVLGVNELVHFMFKVFASCLEGGNPDKYFYMFYGPFANGGKTTLLQVFRRIQGEYAISGSPAMIALRNNQNSSGPSPEWARLKGTKNIIFDEPNPSEKFAAGKVKSISSSDPITARKLNENGGEFRNMAKPMIATNTPIEIPSGGQACRKRLVLVPHFSRWEDDAPSSEYEQYLNRTFKNDPYFEQSAESLAPGLFWIMVQYYPIFRREGIRNLPAIIRYENDKYWLQTDNILKFEREKIVEVRTKDGALDPSCKLSVLELYEAYKVWFHNFFSAEQCPTETQIRYDYTLRWGEPGADMCWIGRKIKHSRKHGESGMPPPPPS